MKKLLLLLLAFFYLSVSKAQWVTIPDSNFVNWLDANGYASCMNGSQMDTTCPDILVTSALFCGYHNIHDLTGIQYFDNLMTLDCQMNQLTSLPTVPSGVFEIYCNKNQLTSLPTLPLSLDFLDCSHNNLTSLPSIPTTVTYIDCSFNQITSLPPLASVTNLNPLLCDYNLLTSLPTLPPYLGMINISHNLLTSLPQLPSTIVIANSNQISSIAWTTNGGSIFNCDSNLITSLPPFPYLSTWGSLYLRHNQITELPPLPTYLQGLYIDGNPISCLPKVSIIDNFSWANTQITCLPNACVIDSAWPPITNLPLCDPLSGCEFYYSTYGKVFLDLNSNCQFDATDMPLEHIRLRLDSAGTFNQQMETMNNGYYSFKTNMGNYSTTLENNYFSNLCPANGLDSFSINAIDSIAENKNFAVSCPATYDLLAKTININGIARPGRTITAVINAGEISSYYNVPCFNVGGNVQAVISGPVQYLGPAPGAITPTSVNGDTINWSIPDFSTINPYQAFNLLIKIDSTASSSSIFCLQLNITPIADNDSSNNSYFKCFEAFNSHDPNSKDVFPINDFDTLSTKWLDYTIHFQNTGNAPAYDIYILDTLDQKLDASTFTWLSSSHHVFIQMLPGRLVKFSFQSINLPDSISNEPLSHGFVSYKIKTLNNLSVGDSVKNTASIYFDLNPAVVTNTTINHLVPLGIIGIDNNNASVFPNPATDFVNINLNNNSKDYRIRILDNLGKLVLERHSHESKIHLDLKSIKKGFYFILIDTSNGASIKKLIKL